MNGLSFPLIFGAGVLSFLSPCVLPLVPPYLTYMSGSSFEQLRADGATAGLVWRRSVVTSIFFILGFSLVFITFGATATAFGQAFRAALPVLMPLAGLFIIAMGLHFLGIFRIGFLDRQLRHSGPGVASGPAGGFLLGLGVPFLLAGIAIGPFLTFFSGFRRHMGTVEKIVGVLLVVTGLLFLTGQFTRIAYWFLETFPVLGTIG